MIAYIIGSRAVETGRVHTTAPWAVHVCPARAVRGVQEGPVRIALVFPGQGSQSVGMARALREGPGSDVFRTADQALGEQLSRVIADGPAELLERTENSQPAILAASIAFHRAWTVKASESGLPAPSYHAGHSMGQYSAMVAADVLDLPDAVRMVRLRGQLAQEHAGGGAMAAIIGLDDARLPELADAGRAIGAFEIANRNSPGQVVISGDRAAVEAACETAKALGAKRAIVLPISIAAHSPLMAGAVDGMRTALDRLSLRDPAVPLLANGDARLLTTAADCRAELLEHLTGGVDWVRTVRAMAAAGVDTFVEVGPGKVLTNLIKRIDPDVTPLATDDPDQPDGVCDPAGLLASVTE
jgi:[acyl-carrier-protein] S-malonyltransferase